MSKRYSNFDSDFDKFDRNLRRGAKAGIVIWAIWVLICLAAVIGIAYVAIHFISKYW